MKQGLVLVTGLALGLSLSSAQAAEPVTIQLKWVANCACATHLS